MTITQRILTQVALGAGLVIAVASVVTYGIVFNATKERDLQHLETYVAERARREETNFRQVEANLTTVRGQFLKRMAAPVPANYQKLWAQRFELFPDGAWRSRREFSDGRKFSTMWMHRATVLTPELQTAILRAQDICDELLPSWGDSFPSLYFNFPSPANIGFDPSIPSWVWDVPADYDMNAQEWVYLAFPAHNPARGFAWSGVLEEEVTKTPQVAVLLPIYRGDQLLCAVAHSLNVRGLMEEATHGILPGVSHMIFRRDGRLIAHPLFKQEIISSKGQLTAQTSGNPTLARLHHLVTQRTDKLFSGYDAQSESYYCVTRLAGPDWFFVTAMPRALLVEQAFASAQWVLWSGLLSLSLVLGVFALILRRQVARPLAEFSRATRQISAGDTSFVLKPERDDELGRLGSAFNLMARNIAERDAALRQEKSSLEQRVVERTAELTASESRFRTLVENAPEAIVVLDADTANGVFVDVNRNAEQLFGLSRAELLQVGPAEMSPSSQPGGTDSAKLAKEKIGEALQGGTPTFEWTHRTAGGKEVACEIRLVRLQAPGKNLVRGSITDITERKRADKRRAIFTGLGQRLSGATGIESAMGIALDVADELFGWDSCSIDLYSAEQNATFAVVTMDTIDGNRVSVPPAYTGSAPSPFMQKTIAEGAQLILRKPRERSAGLVPFGDTARPSASLMFVPMRNGPRVTAVLSLQSYTADAYTPDDLQIFQALADYCGTAVERIQAEQEFRAIFEHSLEGICRTTGEGRLLAANPAFAQMLGFASPDDLMKAAAAPGAQWCVPPEHWGKFLADLAEQTVVRQFETEFRIADGRRLQVTCSGHAVRDARGTVHYLAITAQDVTERKRAESELHKALAREKELSELKSSFIAMVSHEFRTPLGVIVSSADILNRYLDRLTPAERTTHLESIHSSVRRMAGMMEDVLLLGRFERGRLECQPDDLHLGAWCRRLADEMRSATGGRCPIELQLELPDPMVRADEKLLRHILTNLISNAVKYSPLDAAVQLRVRREQNDAVFEIKDQGRGIPPEDQPQIFEAFHRARNVGQIPGTGLGLVIVKRGVDLHGGKIFLTSAEGQGTTFVVRLPIFETNV